MKDPFMKEKIVGKVAITLLKKEGSMMNRKFGLALVAHDNGIVMDALIWEAVFVKRLLLGVW